MLFVDKGLPMTWLIGSSQLQRCFASSTNLTYKRGQVTKVACLLLGTFVTPSEAVSVTHVLGVSLRVFPSSIRGFLSPTVSGMLLFSALWTHLSRRMAMFAIALLYSYTDFTTCILLVQDTHRFPCLSSIRFLHGGKNQCLDMEPTPPK